MIDLGDIVNFVEEDHIIEFAGEFFCVRENCEECTEFEEADLEVSEKPPIRLLIGTEKIDTFVYSQTGLMKNVENCLFREDDGVLPESNFCFMKEVDKPYNEFCLFNQKDDKHYCIRQGCSDCGHFQECNPKVTKIPREYITVALDLKAQEPRANTFVAREPAWLTIFQNDSIRDVPHLLDFLNITFRELGGDTNSSRYRKFVDRMFFLDRTKLYNFNIAIFNMKKDPSKENRAKVRAFIEEFDLEKLASETR